MEKHGKTLTISKCFYWKRMFQLHAWSKAGFTWSADSTVDEGPAIPEGVARQGEDRGNMHVHI